jgi:hypothetical protein
METNFCFIQMIIRTAKTKQKHKEIFQSKVKKFALKMPTQKQTQSQRKG